MTVIISGSAGIQNVLGSAASPAESNTTNSNTGVYFPTSTTLGFSTAGTNAVYIDASQNVGIGQSSPAVKLDVNGATNFGGTSGVRCGVGTAFVGGQAEVYSQGAVPLGIGTASTQVLRFYTNSTLAATIDTSGNLLLGTTNSSLTASVGAKLVTSATEPYLAYVINSAGGSNYHLYNTNATNNGFRFYVTTNGGIANYSANNTNLSDERTKTNIQNAGSYLAKICAIPVRVFKYKDQADDLLNLGVIAQEVEAVAPELVDVSGFGETPEDGIPLKSIYQTDLQYALMKCIQEQQALITQLTDRIAALEVK
jgi:hypothetical protein